MDKYDSNYNKNIVYYDFSLNNSKNKFGELKEYENNDALFQAIKIWLTCARGEKIRSTSGGVLISHIGKIMDDDRAKMIRNDIIYGLEHEFTPNMKVVDVIVNKDIDHSRWIIGIVAYNTDINLGVNGTLVVKN